MKGHIRRRSPKSWELKFDLGRNPETGARVTKYKSVKGTKREAQRELRRVLSALDEGNYIDPSKIKIAQYLRDWLKGRRHSLAPKTVERYDDFIEKQIVPAMGDEFMAKLTTARINRLYADKLENGRLDGSGGLAPQTVRHIDRLLHTAFDDAVREGLLARNPTQYAQRPKVEKKPKRVLNDDELRDLLAKAYGGRLYAPIFSILGTGLRRGELLALKWRNVDLEDGFIHVLQSVEETKAGLRLKDVKSAAGRRRVDIPATVVGVLHDHQLQQKKDHLALGLGWTVDTLVFPSLLGELWRPRNFTKEISRLAKSCSLDGFTPHAGRHDHFTRLLGEGVHPKVAQVRAGHSSIQVTLDVYSHASDAMQREAAERIDNAFRTIHSSDGGKTGGNQTSEAKADLLNH